MRLCARPRFATRILAAGRARYGGNAHGYETSAERGPFDLIIMKQKFTEAETRRIFSRLFLP